MRQERSLFSDVECNINRLISYTNHRLLRPHSLSNYFTLLWAASEISSIVLINYLLPSGVGAGGMDRELGKVGGWS